jgi:hypothetical protein
VRRIAPVGAALVAAVALAGCAHTSPERETAAARLYQSYLAIAIEHPAFVHEKQDILKLPEREGMKYTIFAGMSLGVAQQIYKLAGQHDPSWRTTVKSIIANHHTFIILNFAACADLDREFVEFLKKEVKGYECK